MHTRIMVSKRRPLANRLGGSHECSFPRRQQGPDWHEGPDCTERKTCSISSRDEVTQVTQSGMVLGTHAFGDVQPSTSKSASNMDRRVQYETWYALTSSPQEKGGKATEPGRIAQGRIRPQMTDNLISCSLFIPGFAESKSRMTGL
jgi:hypothetical protein